MRNLISVCAAILIVTPCAARTITVDDDGPADFNNIQAAIDDANDGDTIVVQPGTYTGEGNRDIDFRGKAITVRSTDPNDPQIVAATIIDCNGTIEHPHRGFLFRRTEGADSVIDGLMITNGFAPWSVHSEPGAGIYCRGISSTLPGPTIRNCIITGNKARIGDFLPTDSAGGGIYGSMGPIVNCTIAGNAAERGGGIADCTGPIVNCSIAENTAKRGGGIAGCTGRIVNCTIAHNSAERGGGVADCTGPLDNCLINGNSAGPDLTHWRGGGLYGCTGPITNCIISGNESSGLANCTGPISNCTVVGNRGCGLYNSDLGVKITNCIFWANEPICWLDPSQPPPHEYRAWEMYLVAPPHGPTLSVRHTDVESGQAEVWAWPPEALDWGPGNIDADPCFVEPGRWVDVNDPNTVAEPNDPNAVWV
jgi:hypothetical protein